MEYRRHILFNQEVVSILCCPQCKGNLKYIKNTKQHWQFPDAWLLCSDCSNEYPIVEDVPLFADSDKYVDTFSMEWDKHKQTQLDSVSGLTRADEMFFERTGFTKEEIKGKLILDAGCGIGRFTEVVKKYGGNIIGIDLSNSVYFAVNNVPDATIIQADIHNLPFKENSFDYVFSLGVIHHTSDTRKAFDCLARLVKIGGKMSVWVYSNQGWKFKVYNMVADFYRIFTTRMPKNLLYMLSHLAIPLYYIHRIPILGLFTKLFLATSMESNPEWRVLDTFDWYSPKYQTKHTYNEVTNWFYSCGFNNVRQLKVPVSVQGVKIER